MSEIFHLEVSDGIATITWDLPGARMNVLTEAGIRELDAAVEAVLADPGVRGAIITSAKPDFAGGMDLNVLASLREKAAAEGRPAEVLFGFVMALHGLLRKIERGGADPRTGKGGKPFVWACPGTAMGIGVEIGLACHRRIAADRPGAKIGLPEIKVGLFPGAGGTTRLFRMLGLMAAAPFLLEGKTPEPKKARAAKLVDDVVAPGELLPAARAWLAEATEADAVKPWDAKGFRIPGGAPYTAQGFELFLGAAAMTHGRTQGVYPAAEAMLRAIYEGALVPFDTAIRIEARQFTRVLMEPTAEAMIRSLFLSKQALEKGASRPEGEPDAQVRRLGVLGAGMMGAGIAHAAAQAGIEVVLIDRDEASAGRGRDAVAKILDDAVTKRRISGETRDATLARITATTDHAALAGADLVVEAVFEDPGIKAEVTAQAEAVLGPEAIFATNTSTLPITELARASARPERYIGIHFFSPVHKMMLVEIIKGRQTGPAAVARALDFVRQIRKTPIVVNDARFFYANRCIIPYVNEGLQMVTEGVLPPLIDNVAKGMGMPVGPLQLVDETSLELGLRIQKATAAAAGAAYLRGGADDLLERLVGEGRLGRKAFAGLYDYDERGRRQGFWPGLAGIWPPAEPQPAPEAVRARLQMIQALEAVRALEEGVLEDIREGDVGAILGWGFMPWSGGPFSWLDRIGAAEALALAERLAAEHGGRFAPPALLAEMAARGESFYGRFGQAAAA
ncbi:3-hydroxyacyl-CoA dehydrogenase NAD-binding domain-containing protein [Paralimibaculum aggregatum]|uniref:3-hydroxyacyl-CoA dehydrogenase NAD-binding domain-containing protein n=1 Tax=Paralimibaculum aggregatum TaxID=3036245 RepID=A0ABQ6LRK1_9RHOB|nr:3-hydroxyacyl-CoA dehydrogenase NAD-binding domain-containing protein [Limibaculum sp. NKW23]GMG84074.1 3-hydroxyacyl-CoA dehydrogenase NAD-binding domain-containing protein [Limibaculum sp. NKW23]